MTARGATPFIAHYIAAAEPTAGPSAEAAAELVEEAAAAAGGGGGTPSEEPTGGGAPASPVSFVAAAAAAAVEEEPETPEEKNVREKVGPFPFCLSSTSQLRLISACSHLRLTVPSSG
jgi:hypothetical protein